MSRPQQFDFSQRPDNMFRIKRAGLISTLTGVHAPRQPDDQRLNADSSIELDSVVAGGGGGGVRGDEGGVDNLAADYSMTSAASSVVGAPVRGQADVITGDAGGGTGIGLTMTSSNSDTQSDSEINHFPGEMSDGSSQVAEEMVLDEIEARELRVQKWNVFMTAPWKDASDVLEHGYDVARKILKVLTYLVMMPCMLALLVLSKGSALIAISNLRPLHHQQNPPPFDTTAASTAATTLWMDFTSVETTSPSAAAVEQNVTAFQNTTQSSETTTAFAATASNYIRQMRCTIYDEVMYRVVALNSTFSTVENISGTVTKCVTTPLGYTYDDDVEMSCLVPQNRSGSTFNQTFTFNDTYGADQCFVSRNYWAWSILLMICVPHMFVFLRCLWRVVFKKKKTPHWQATVCVLVTETLYTIGVCLLMFLVLPSLDNAVTALLIMLGVSTLPSLLKITIRKQEEPKRVLKIILDSVALFIQISMSVLWPLIVVFSTDNHEYHLIWSLPTSVFLISIRWWENYLDTDSKLGPLYTPLKMIARANHTGRTKIMLFASLWKIGISVLMMMACVGMQVNDMDPLIDDFNELSFNRWTAVFNFDISQCSHHDNKTDITKWAVAYDTLPELELDWVWVWLVNCLSGLVGYFFARSSAKMQIQRLTYSLPLVICTPLMFGLMIAGCELWNSNPCAFATNELSGYLFYKCYESGTLGYVAMHQIWFLWPLWWFSQLWITWHVWFPKSERMAKAEKLFVLPLYDGVLLEQSLLLNRNRNDEPRNQSKIMPVVSAGAQSQIELARMQAAEDGVGDFVGRTILQNDQTPMIYICGTMWHETEGEQITMLKSLFKLDIDQAARNNAQKYFHIKDPDFYEFEAHIFFDNAFDDHGPTEHTFFANSYVKQLVSVVSQAATEVHEIHLQIPPPEMIPTPYGGRLIWTMPGGNQIIVHLKDAAKIRIKKRWSQVMYMYYFLGFKLFLNGELGARRKQVRADNTFLLALDGDVDFEPLALRLVVDLMRRNAKVGAACGRIHPTGSGPMVWYQKFEYALGHWMQKATEHVIGCVLCSPGCFSLFRGSAIMDDNVMAKYTTKPTEPHHYIQYDQGEDRWLCTLLLQQGYRVEYCAASDSYTMAPEGFEEFFNQRRRWMPSTMANVFDLLMSWRQTTKVNENISMLYILYQMLLLGSSIVGPGTIFMMMCGAMDVALGGRLGFKLSFLINFIPLMIFILLCYFTKAKIQVNFAALLTAVYCLVQMLVLIGLMVQMATMGICFPTTVFFLFVSGTFIGAAIIHPQEFMCLMHGMVYYLAIPTMYMLLMIYAMCNLDNVSWGTREVKQTPTEKQIEEAKLAEAEQKRKEAEKKKNGGIMSTVFGKGGSDEKDGWTLSCGTCCSYVCCPHKVNPEERVIELKLILAELKNVEHSMERNVDEKIAALQKAIEDLKTTVIEIEEVKKQEQEYDDNNDGLPTGDDYDDDDQCEGLNSEFVESIRSEPIPKDTEEICGSDCHPDAESESIQEPVEPASAVPDVRDDLVNPVWAEDEAMGGGPVKVLAPDEKLFFEDLIEVYLAPLLKDKIQEEKLKMQLRELKNKMSISFLLLNGIFVVVVFVMQLNMDVLYVPWPCGDDVRIEPLGFVFMIMFGVIMLIQIAGMLVHRTSTFFHIMSTTVLRFCGRKDDKEDTELVVDFARQMGRLQHEDQFTINTRASMGSMANSTWKTENDFEGDDVRLPKRKAVVEKLVKNARQNKKRAPLNQSIAYAFQRRNDKLERAIVTENGQDVDAAEIQRKVLGQTNAGYVDKQKTQAAMKTIMARKNTIRATGVSAADIYGSSAGGSNAVTGRTRYGYEAGEYSSSSNDNSSGAKKRYNYDDEDDNNNNVNRYNYNGELDKFRYGAKKDSVNGMRQRNALNDVPEEDYDSD